MSKLMQSTRHETRAVVQRLKSLLISSSDLAIIIGFVVVKSLLNANNMYGYCCLLGPAEFCQMDKPF